MLVVLFEDRWVRRVPDQERLPGYRSSSWPGVNRFEQTELAEIARPTTPTSG
jgi:hypothetical protein